MTLKEELEILRGEPIEAFTGDPMDIPCIETSDAEKLCKHPVVSVQMITYNHEPYIRQAIECVMMQKVDFEFELIIGEDCSKDKTREICFEYQKKYPDKIRVLWWHENVSKLGGNSCRCRARCRGEFIALCEGDDYWTDPYKLQKQVDVLRTYSNVNLVFGEASVYDQKKGVESCVRKVAGFKAGVVSGEEFLASGSVVPTLTVLFRKCAWEVVHGKYDIFKWRLKLGDKRLWIALALMGDFYYIGEKLGTYRFHGGGVSHRNDGCISRDGGVVSAYFSRFNPAFSCLYSGATILHIYTNRMIGIAKKKRFKERLALVRKVYDEVKGNCYVTDALFQPGRILSILMGEQAHLFYRKIVGCIRGLFIKRLIATGGK